MTSLCSSPPDHAEHRAVFSGFLEALLGTEQVGGTCFMAGDNCPDSSLLYYMYSIGECLLSTHPGPSSLRSFVGM